MAGPPKNGWVKSYRAIESSPLWAKHAACRVFLWLLWNAEPETCTASTVDGPVVLMRGDLYVSYPEAASRILLSVDQVKRAFLALRKLGLIAWSPRTRGMVVTVTDYCKHQDSLPPVPMEGERDDAPAPRTADRTAENSVTAPQEIDATPRLGNGLPDAVNPPAHRDRTAPRTAHRTAITKEEEVSQEVINNPPNPPFEKGGACASSPDWLLQGELERVRGVLDLWRDVREKAGMCVTEGTADLAAAEMLVRNHLGTSLSLAQLRAGMRELIRRIATDSKAKGYTLRALARNPAAFCPGRVSETPKRRLVRWRLVCDVCGHEETTDWAPADGPMPAAQECSASAVQRWRDDGGKEHFGFAAVGCQGRMHPLRGEERLA